MGSDRFVLAQISDLHFGDGRFDQGLADSIAFELNDRRPDLLVVAGDLTEAGYREQFESGTTWLDLIRCPNRLVIPGNHDARNVGYTHFADLFGPRYSSRMLDLSGQRVLLVGADTSKPDLNQGELGRVRHLWLYDECSRQADFKILALHHHLVSIPGTGRERNILWDAGDILEILAETGVDLVICGHKHVPYVWDIAGMTISTSGTACTRRTRGKTPPSFTIIEVEPDEMRITMRNTGQPTGRTAVVPRRHAVDREKRRPQRGRQAAEIGARIESLT